MAESHSLPSPSNPGLRLTVGIPRVTKGPPHRPPTPPPSFQGDRREGESRQSFKPSTPHISQRQGARSVHLGLTRRVGGFFAVWTAFGMVASAFSGSFSPSSAPRPGPQASYTAFPTAGPRDGEFMSVAGQGLNTLAGIAVIAYAGRPAGTSSYAVGIFDGATGGAWARVT